MAGQPDAQGDLYGGPLKNEDPPPTDDVAQYTDPNVIKSLALASDPERVSGSGQDYLNFQKAFVASGEKGDLQGFLQSVSAEIDQHCWSGANSGAPDAQLQMSMLWQSAQELSDSATALGTVLQYHGDNNIKPFRDYFNGSGFTDATTTSTTTYKSAGGGGKAAAELPEVATTTTTTDAAAQIAKTAQLALTNHNKTIASTYEALPGYLTLTLPPNVLPPAPATDPALTTNGKTAPTTGPGGPGTGPGTSGPGNGGTLPANTYVPHTGGTAPGTGPGTAPGTLPGVPGSTTAPGVNGLPPGSTVPGAPGTNPTTLSNVPPGTTPPGTTPPGTTPIGTTPPGTIPTGTTPPGSTTTPPGVTPPGVVPPVLTPPTETGPGKTGVTVPKLPTDPTNTTDPKLPAEPKFTEPKITEPKFPGDFSSTGSTGGTGDIGNPGIGNAADTAVGSAGTPSAAQDGTFAEDAMMGQRAAAMSAGGMGNGMMPMAPMGGMGGPNGQDQERMAWLAEDEEIWVAGIDAVPPVIG